MSGNRKKQKRSLWRRSLPLLWGLLFFALILWLAYNRTDQIEKRLSTSFSLSEWVAERWESIRPRRDATPSQRRSFPRVAHYDCLEIPAPLSDGRPHYTREYAGYTISYNTDWHLPNWVAYELLRSELKAQVPRRDNFRPDESMPLDKQASLADYRRSGFDRGHMAPAADMRWSAQAMSHSFYLTNICPQTPGLNQGDWKRLEDKIRDWARNDSAIVIVCGPLVSSGDTTIGPHKVKVPSAYYKVVLSPYADPPRGIGFIFENCSERRRQPLDTYAVTIDSVEARARIDFFPQLPDDIEQYVESQYDTRYWNF